MTAAREPPANNATDATIRFQQTSDLVSSIWTTRTHQIVLTEPGNPVSWCTAEISIPQPTPDAAHLRLVIELDYTHYLSG